MLPFGNVEDGVGSIETGENAGISGLEHTAESGDLELSGESDGIGSYQDGMENISGTGAEAGISMEDSTAGSGIPSFGGMQEISASGLDADHSGTGGMGHMDGAGTVPGTGQWERSSGNGAVWPYERFGNLRIRTCPANG